MQISSKCFLLLTSGVKAGEFLPLSSTLLLFGELGVFCGVVGVGIPDLTLLRAVMGLLDFFVSLPGVEGGAAGLMSRASIRAKAECFCIFINSFRCSVFTES